MFGVDEGDSWRAMRPRRRKGVELLTYCYLGNSTKCSSSSSCLHLPLLPLLLSSGFFLSPRRSLLAAEENELSVRIAVSPVLQVLRQGLLKYNCRTCDSIQRIGKFVLCFEATSEVIISSAHVRDLFVFFRRSSHLSFAFGYVLGIFPSDSRTLNLPSRCGKTLKAFQ